MFSLCMLSNQFIPNVLEVVMVVKEFSQDGRIHCSLLPEVSLIFMEKIWPAGSGNKPSSMSVCRRCKSFPSASVCSLKARDKRRHSVGEGSQEIRTLLRSGKKSLALGLSRALSHLFSFLDKSCKCKVTI